jgi:nicotinamide-nucleotide amidase
MKAYILNIGDEILIGQIVNTNAAWMATELNAHGISVARIITLADTRDAIEEAVVDALAQADIILMTGGLGPTKDDITKKALADLFELELDYHEASFENIARLFQQFGKIPDDRYKLQAFMPVGATVLINKMGTASGMWFEVDGKLLVSMPGVPKEMKYLMSHEVLPRLEARQDIPAIEHHTLMCYGKGETDLSEMLEDFEAQLPSHIKLAYLPNTTTGYVRLRLSGKGDNKNQLKGEVNTEAEKIKSALGSLIIGGEGDSLEKVLGAILLEKGLSLGTAESCTGGNVAHKITSVPGSSKYYQGSVIAYSNAVKVQSLAVKQETLDQFGAVSEQTVIEMARGLQKTFQVDCAIATSGIAGPDGARPDKPIGTICVAVAIGEVMISKQLQLGNERIRNIELTTNIALNILRMHLMEIDF